MKRLMLFALVFVMSLPVWAKNSQSLHPTINLVNISAVTTAERQGDELYMSVTAYPSSGRPTHYVIPKPPLHWLSDHLEQINTLKLWDGRVAQGEAVTLIFSLIEMDVPPWNTDDLVGTIRVHIKNDAGQLTSSWSMPNRSDEPIIVRGSKGATKQFEFIDDEGGHYKLTLGLEAASNNS